MKLNCALCGIGSFKSIRRISRDQLRMVCSRGHDVVLMDDMLLEDVCASWVFPDNIKPITWKMKRYMIPNLERSLKANNVYARLNSIVRLKR